MNTSDSEKKVRLWRRLLRAYLIAMPVLGVFCMWGLLHRSEGTFAAGMGYALLRFVFLPLSLIMPPLITFIRPDKDFRLGERPVGRKLLIVLLTAYQIAVIALSYGAAFLHSLHTEAVAAESSQAETPNSVMYFCKS